MITAKINVDGLNKMIPRFVTELGKSSAAVIGTESRRTAVRISKDASPKNLEKAKKSAKADAGRQFHPAETKAGVPYSIFPVSQRGNKAMVWIYSTPNVLLGVDKTDFQPNLKASEMAKILHSSKGVKRDGKWNEIGTRGNQKIVRLNRILVRPTEFKTLVTTIQNRLGKLKASFVSGVIKNFGTYEIKVPQWVNKHIVAGNAHGTAINRLQEKNPSFTIISTATGCESKTSIRNINAALVGRAKAMAADLRNQLKGAYKRANE